MKNNVVIYVVCIIIGIIVGALGVTVLGTDNSQQYATLSEQYSDLQRINKDLEAQIAQLKEHQISEQKVIAKYNYNAKTVHKKKKWQEPESISLKHIDH